MTCKTPRKPGVRFPLVVSTVPSGVVPAALLAALLLLAGCAGSVEMSQDGDGSDRMKASPCACAGAVRWRGFHMGWLRRRARAAPADDDAAGGGEGLLVAARRSRGAGGGGSVQFRGRAPTPGVALAPVGGAQRGVGCVAVVEADAIGALVPLKTVAGV